MNRLTDTELQCCLIAAECIRNAKTDGSIGRLGRDVPRMVEELKELRKEVNKARLAVSPFTRNQEVY